MRLYLDTSVYGGYFDKEFDEWTREFFKILHQYKDFTILLSYIVDSELEKAPPWVKNLPYEIFPNNIEIIEGPDPKALDLAQHYIREGALVSKRCYTDANHIALATICKADIIVSWNFSHMVNTFRIKQFNNINLQEGYPLIDIRSPDNMCRTLEQLPL